MMAAALVLREIIARFQKIESVDPGEFLAKNHEHPIVQKVLRRETTFTDEVGRGVATIEQFQKAKPQYFDLTPEYGELVKLFAGEPKWCCDNGEAKRSITVDSVIWGILTVLINIAFLFVFVMIGYMLSYGMWIEGVMISPQEKPILCVLFLIPMLIIGGFWVGCYRHMRTPKVVKAHESFFIWAPAFWRTMHEKAKEIDMYLYNN